MKGDELDRIVESSTQLTTRGDAAGYVVTLLRSSSALAFAARSREWSPTEVDMLEITIKDVVSDVPENLTLNLSKFAQARCCDGDGMVNVNLSMPSSW